MTYTDTPNQRAVLLFELQQANDELEMNALGVRLPEIDKAIEALRKIPVRVEPTPEQWKASLEEERQHQYSLGYDEAHDRFKGPEHLLRWAQEYARRGRMVECAALIESACDLLPKDLS